MDINEMETIQLDMEGSLDLLRVQEVARDEVEDDDLRLIAWYDRTRETGGPNEACEGEAPECVRDYASSHGAERRVWVNDGAFEFYFSRTGEDVEELDKEWALEVHSA
jgi:hypothetical protein